MNVKTKYSIGDIVKVISPKGKETILEIDNIIIHVDSNNSITTEYNNRMYRKEVEDDYGCRLVEYIPIMESKEATNDCPLDYIKCKVSIVEE